MTYKVYRYLLIIISLLVSDFLSFSQNRNDLVDSTSFSKILYFTTTENCIGTKIEFEEIDSINQTSNVKINFKINKRALQIMSNDFTNKLDSSVLSNSAIITFSNVPFYKYSPYGILSKSKRLYLNKFNGLSINDSLEGTLKFKANTKGRSSWVLLIQTNNSIKYFFQYEAGVIIMYSTNSDFINAISELKPRQRKINGKKESKPYSYFPDSGSKLTKFIKLYGLDNE